MYGIEPRYNEPRYNEPQYNEPRYNEPRYNEFFDITNIIRKPKRKIYLRRYNELQCPHVAEDKC